MKVCIITFGCKVNQYESEAMYQTLCDVGHTRCDNSGEADAVVFNSCAVTAESTRKLRQCLRKVKSTNPRTVLAVVGCIPQAFPDELEQFSDVDIVLGNFNKKDIVLYLDAFCSGSTSRHRIVNIDKHGSLSFEETASAVLQRRARAFLKIEDGCDRYCSYCVIPYTRGEVRSKSLHAIYQEAINLSKNGYKEIVLVGINLSSYGKDIGSDLGEAVKTVAKAEGIERIRLSSLEPDLVNEEMLLKFKKIGDKFCPHFHLSLQSGSNRILKAMKRRYCKDEYVNIANKIKIMFKNAQITTDIIVGFPGETEQDFRETLQVIGEVGFLKVHVFPYSARAGTDAAKMSNQIRKSVKSERVRAVMLQSQKQTKLILNKYLGFIVYVLYEKQKSDNFFEGYSQNYILIATQSKENIEGQILPTKITKCEVGFCIGELV